MTKPHLYCIWNRDWIANALTWHPLSDTGWAGAAYRSAMLRAAGKLPEEPLSEAEMQAFRDEVRALPNMQNLQDAS